jgi:hypothetical protein
MSLPKFQKPTPKYPNAIQWESESMTIIGLSSTWNQTSWIWEDYQLHLNQRMAGNLAYGTVSYPFTVSVEYNLLQPAKVRYEVNQPDMTQEKFFSEYLALFHGESEGAYYTLRDIEGCRTLERCFVPPTNAQYNDAQGKKKSKKLSIKDFPPKSSNEVRIVVADLAFKKSTAGKRNDASCYVCVQLIPTSRGYQRNFVHMQTNEGVQMEEQALRLKRLFYDFDADYLGYDQKGSGLGMNDHFMKGTYDVERGIDYPAWNYISDDYGDDNEHAPKDAARVLRPFNASHKSNHEMAVDLKSSLEQRRISFLRHSEVARQDFESRREYIKLEPNERLQLTYPFNETSLFQDEIINLLREDHSGYIRLKEQGTRRKDRFSAVLYANFFATELQRKNLKPKKEKTALMTAMKTLSVKADRSNRKERHGYGGIKKPFKWN